MNPCNNCERPKGIKCCHNCKKDASRCSAYNTCGDDCPEWEKWIFTNADRIRAMSDEELAKEMLFFCPTDTVFKGDNIHGKPHYTGLDGIYYETSEEVISSNIVWLKQPVEEE